MGVGVGVGSSSHRRALASAVGLITLITLLVSACAIVSGVDGYSVDGEETTTPEGGAANNPNANLPKGISVPSEVVLNDVRCGETAIGRLTITNDTDKATPFEAILPEESIVKFAGGARTKTDTLGARSKLEIELTASAPIPGSIVEAIAIFVGPERIAGAINVKVTSKGPLLNITSPVVGFGEVRQNTTPPAQAIEFENTGNEPITISGVQNSSTDFTVASGPLVVAPGEKQSLAVSFLPGAAGPQVETNVTVETTPASCVEIPPVKLTGWRVNQAVTVNPSTHSFGDVDCKSTSAATKTITISNYSTQLANAQLTLPNAGNSVFTISPTSATIPAANGTTPGTKTFTIGLKSPVSSTPGAYAEQIQVVLTGPESGTKMVDVSMTVAGAVLEIAPATLVTGTGSGRPFDVKNSGNRPIAVEYRKSANSFAVNPDNQTVNPAQTTHPNVRYVGGPGGSTAQITTMRDNIRNPPGSSQLCNTPAVVQVHR